MSARINRGKDLSYNSVELTITGEPLAYVAISAMEYQLYDLGARNSLSMHEVNELWVAEQLPTLYSYTYKMKPSCEFEWFHVNLYRQTSSVSVGKILVIPDSISSEQQNFIDLS